MDKGTTTLRHNLYVNHNDATVENPIHCLKNIQYTKTLLIYLFIIKFKLN